MRRTRYWLGVVLLSLPSLAVLGPVQAQEYCVTCTGPDALYRCVIDGARPGGSSLQMLCISSLARHGGHATCSVKGGTVFDCNGPVKRVPWVASDAQPLPPTGESTAAPKAPAKSNASADEPPKTMAELAKRANEKNAEQMKKAGEDMKDAAKSMNDATKKTWECVASFFTRC